MSSESFSGLGLPSLSQNLKAWVFNELRKGWLSLNFFPLNFCVLQGCRERTDGFVDAIFLHQIKRVREVAGLWLSCW